MEPMAVRIAEAVQISTLSKSTLEKAIRNGALRSVKNGKSRLIFVDDLRDFLKGTSVEMESLCR
jgi:excisionase family DNA binding protein